MNTSFKQARFFFADQRSFFVFLISMIQQTALVIREITLMIKKAINSGEICCKSEVTDQTIAPNEVIRHTIQKKVMFSFIS